MSDVFSEGETVYSYSKLAQIDVAFTPVHNISNLSRVHDSHFHEDSNPRNFGNIQGAQNIRCSRN